jgi:K+-transporting ATPase ATPase A chain
VTPAVVQDLVFLVVLTLLVAPVGSYLFRVFTGAPTPLHRVLAPVERAIYRLCRVDAARAMTWQAYVFALLAFALCSGTATYVLLRAQDRLPLDPAHFGAVSPEIAWNTAVSFLTTTDWQAYAGESTLSYLSQMAALGTQNFVAAGVGLTVAIALFRALAHERTGVLGNAWVDLTRGVLYVLLPLSILTTLLFVWQGIPQNFTAPQTITGGPVASQQSISLIGGNGGGFVAANVTSPSENPTPLVNFFELLATLIIPAALTSTFGKFIGDRRQGWALYAVMLVALTAGIAGASLAETAGNPLVHALGINGANMEGKETRFGAAGAGLSIAVATAATTGAANATYDSLTPLGGLVAMVEMQTSEVIFGGVGTGITGMLLFVILTVFIAGLMVGRTPEYLGKKIERREVVLVIIAVLVFTAAVLVPAGIAAVVPAGRATLGNAGPHGFSEILYAFTSTAASNGSAFAGLGPNTFYDVLTGIVMMAGRYAVIVPTLALAGALAAKPRNLMPSAGTLDTASPTFGMLLVAVIVVVGALTFLPADALGPVAEQLESSAGRSW